MISRARSAVSVVSRRREGSSRRSPRQARKLATRVLIVCGGACTEKQYFDELRRWAHNPAVKVKIRSEVGSPSQIVNYAAGFLRRGGDDFDAVWAVVDVDDFTDLELAASESRKTGVRLAVSNPCFELWLLLHLVDHRQEVTTAEVQKLLQRHCPAYDKTSIRFSHFVDGIDNACGRAQKLDPDGGGHARNPSTNVWKLIGEVRPESRYP